MAQQKKPKTENVSGYKVVTLFRDKGDFSKIYQPGEAFGQGIDQSRIDSLLQRGLIAKIGQDPEGSTDELGLGDASGDGKSITGQDPEGTDAQAADKQDEETGKV